jgi:hypothetical protein
MSEEVVVGNYKAKQKAYIAIVFLIIATAVLAFLMYEPEIKHSGPLKSHLPMVILKDKTALYQVVTYEDKPITVLEINLKPKFRQAFKNVYLNYRSQFVFNNGEPILYMEEPIFWNGEGDVVDYNYNVINESHLFYVDESAIKHGTAITLLELKSIAKAKYHRALRDNVRMEELRIIKNANK